MTIAPLLFQLSGHLLARTHTGFHSVLALFNWLFVSFSWFPYRIVNLSICSSPSFPPLPLPFPSPFNVARLLLFLHLISSSWSNSPASSASLLLNRLSSDSNRLPICSSPICAHVQFSECVRFVCASNLLLFPDWTWSSKTVCPAGCKTVLLPFRVHFVLSCVVAD